MTKPTPEELLREALAFCDVPREAKVVYLKALDELTASRLSDSGPDEPTEDDVEAAYDLYCNELARIADAGDTVFGALHRREILRAILKTDRQARHAASPTGDAK